MYNSYQVPTTLQVPVLYGPAPATSKARCYAEERREAVADLHNKPFCFILKYYFHKIQTTNPSDQPLVFPTSLVDFSHKIDALREK